MHTTRELIELFIIECYPSLLSGIVIPKLKFIFNDDIYEILEDVKNNPFVMENVWTPNICGENIEFLRNNNNLDNDDFVIYVNDSKLFFEKLTKLINAYSKYKEEHYSGERGRYLMVNYLKDALWLKLLPSDFSNIYAFLDREIAFLEDRTFDKYDVVLNGYTNDNIFDTYMDNIIVAKRDENSFWFETVNNMSFDLINREKKLVYYLPSIHYGIDNGKCYIYGIQNISISESDKKLERDLYKLNKGINNPINHPSFVLALKTFIDMLNKENITDIEVPLLEVINYDYHQMTGSRTKMMFERQWRDLSDLSEDEMVQYEIDKENYKKFVDKEDFISKNKIEGLTNLFYRIEEQFDNIEIIPDDFKLNVKIKEKTKRL